MASPFPVLRQLSNSYLCGRIPSLNVLLFAIELLGLGHVLWRYGDHFASKPILTSMVTNAILNGLADTVAQTVTAVRRRAARRKTLHKKDSVSIEIHEKIPPHQGQLGELYALSSPFDFERLIRFMAWGFLMAPLQFKWFEFLSDTFPITDESAWASTMWRLILDQIVFSPIGLALFFVFMTVAEGGGKRAVTKKFDSVFMATMKSNYMLWPAVQILNFRVIPLHLQLPFASSVGICWNIYLSLKNDAAEAYI